MRSLARVIIASEPVYQIDRSLQASALYARVSAISGFTSAETPHRGSASAPTEPRPRAQSIHSDLHADRRTRSEAALELP